MTRTTLAAALAFGLLAAPLAADAQQPKKIPRIGYLGNTQATPEARRLWEAFRQGLRERGWIDGQNLLIEYRWAEGKFDRLPELATDLVRLKPDLIVAVASQYVEPLKKATSTIPIVFILHADPVGTGHVASLARPGGNITGQAILQTETSVKSLELLKEAVPGLRQVAVLWNPDTPSHGPGLKAVELAAPTLGIQLQALSARNVSELESVFSAIVRERPAALLVLASPLFFAEKQRLAEFTLKHRLPAAFGTREHVEAGGLLSYGVDYAGAFRSVSSYIDKILKGAKPADLPVQQATKIELVVNLKTAKAFGLTLPQSLLIRADEVIQ